MSTFVDTSALLALVNVGDEHHVEAAATFAAFDDSEVLVTTNYVVVETVALVQRRLGLAVLATLRHDLLDALEVHWVDPVVHEAALDTLETGGRRGISFVDHTSFGFMSQTKVRAAFAFDDDFGEAGFTVVPSPPTRQGGTTKGPDQ